MTDINDGRLNGPSQAEPVVSALRASVPDAFMGNDDGSATGYMCLTDWEYEIGNASGGNTIHPSISDLRRNRKCVDGCGIVEVRVHCVRVVQPASDPFPYYAQGTETGTAETEGFGPKDDGPVACDAPEGGSHA